MLECIHEVEPLLCFSLEQILRGLQKSFKDVCIPYWDTALDYDLPDPRDSALWTKYYWGKNSGQVTDGKLCKNWEVTPLCDFHNGILTRQIYYDKNYLYSRDSISNLLATPSYTELSLSGSRFEIEHGLIHCYVGTCGTNSHIVNLECAPNDPVFFMLHSFVDCLWHEWYDMPGKDRNYPTPGVLSATSYNIGRGHQKYDNMDPFGLANINGQRQNFYTRCRERPSLLYCGDNDEDCNSPTRMLFCHNCLCKAKVAPDGDCTGLPDRACYCHRKKHIPKCENNRCKCY